MNQIVAIAFFLIMPVAQLLADGKMFWREEIPPMIPYQRALILFADGTETLILQSRYEIPEANGASNLGWVVPVPAVPEVASMPADMAQYLFQSLGMYSRPNVTRIGPYVVGLLILVIGGLSLLTLLLCLVSFVTPLPPRFQSNRRWLASLSVVVLGYFMVAGIFYSAGSAGLGVVRGVDVISEQRVGIYDVSIVRSDDAGDLIDWLNTHGFKFQDKDTAAFDSYVSQGWCFVVAIINPRSDEAEHRIAVEGLAAPLILRFPTPSPVYPVALTGTGGFETEILIYLASSGKMTCGDRLPLRFAGPMDARSLHMLSVYTDPEGFFDFESMNFPHVTKFNGQLTPEEMKEDIVFTRAEDDEPFRERIIKW